MKQGKMILSYFLIFLMGVWCGGGAVWKAGWGLMASLMGTHAQAKYRAVDASMDAYEQTKLLSLLRLGESQSAIDQAEWILDRKTIEAATWAKEAQDAQVNKMQRGELRAVKRYRNMYPAQGKFKSDIGKVLSQVPDLPAPKTSVSASQMTALQRLYMTKK